jgi:hypothetical protein
VSGCASAPKLDQIPNGETVSIVVAVSPTADGQTELKNDATGKDVGIGAGGGAVGGGLLGLLCGPWAVVCVPYFATYGAIGGGVAGAVVSSDGSLSSEQATQLRDRMLRFNESHDKLAELTTNINDRAARYWDLSSSEPQTTVRVGVHNLKFATTHGDQVRAILQVSVMVFKKSDQPLNAVPVVWGYEYSSPYANLDEWLDDKSDFADTSISSAIRQLSSEIISDLAISSNTGATVQFAKAQPQSNSNGASPAFEFYGEAEDEINNNTYNKNVWDRALVETVGDQTKRKARYIELRANQLYIENGGSLSAIGLYEQPATVLYKSSVDVSGTYVSEATTGSDGQAHGGVKVIKNTDGKLITIKQTGNTITGSDSSKTIKINGTREGNIIKFFIIRGNEIEGSWEINADATNLEGKWFTNGGGGASGIWNLTRVE